MKITRIAWAAYGLALIVLLLDQATKGWILEGLSLREVGSVPVLPPILNFSYVENRGVSFGLFGGGGARWLFTVFAVLVSGALAWWAARVDRRLLISAIGLLIGGALGNAVDRVRFGYVVDFIDFSGTGLFPWVFNVADAAVSVGVALLLADGFLSERRGKVAGAGATDGAAEPGA